MTISRRDVLKATAAGAAAGMLGCSTESAPAPPPRAPADPPPRLPALFVSHGSPRQALAEDDYAMALRAFAAANFKPQAIVVVSAHWVKRTPVRVTTGGRPKTIYDFRGFEKALHEFPYPAPGHPALAKDVLARLADEGFTTEADPDRGFDHGVWVPLSILYPGAALPVVAVSLPSDLETRDLLRLGRALAPLRDRGALVVGSGGITHNFDVHGEDPRMRAFDAWTRERLERMDVEAIADYAKASPDAEYAHPSTEHWDPVYAVLGAAAAGERVSHVYEGFRGGFSMRCFATGA